MERVIYTCDKCHEEMFPDGDECNGCGDDICKVCRVMIDGEAWCSKDCHKGHNPEMYPDWRCPDCGKHTCRC